MWHSHATAVMKDHIDGHSIADLISVVSTEVPISTESALSMEANTVGEQIKHAAFQIKNLYGGEMYFLAGKKGVKSFKSAEPKIRPEDIAHIVFQCNIDANEIDARIKQEILPIKFSLKLPQAMYNLSTTEVTSLSMPVSGKRPQQSAGLNRLLEDSETLRKNLDGSFRNFEGTKVKQERKGQGRQQQELQLPHRNTKDAATSQIWHR